LVLPIVGSMMVALGIFQVFMDLRTSKQRKVIDRLKESRTAAREQKVKESLLRKRASDMQNGVLENVVAKMQIVSKIQKMLDQADLDWSASKMLLNQASVAVMAGAGLMMMQFSQISCLAASAGVMLLPLIWLVHKRKKRVNKLVEQLPDVFELMSQALRAGHSLPGAIQMITEQMPEPIAGEFARVFHEQNLGIKVEEALLNMANRTDQMDVRFFVTAVLIQRQTGGDLAEVLDKIGKVIRDRIQLFGTVQALTAEGRLSGWVLLLLPVVVFLACMIMNPEYASVLTDTDPGRMMLGSAIAMDLMGLAMIKKIVNIKV